MKKTWLILALCALALLLCGCGETGGKKPLKDAVKAAVTGADELVAASQEDLADLMGIEAEEYDEFVYLTSADGLSAREVVALRAKDEDAKWDVFEKLNVYLSRRRRETRDYLPDQYEILIRSRVEYSGNTVALIVGDNAQEEMRKLLAGE